MKTIFGYILIVICLWSINVKANREIKDDEVRARIFDLVKLKHEYERMLYRARIYKVLEPAKTIEAKDKYFSAVKEVSSRSTRKVYLSYLDRSIENSSDSLSKKVVLYEYQDPLSSYFDKYKMVSYLDYLRVVRYSLFQVKSDSLVSLDEVPSMKIFKLIRLKHDYEQAMMNIDNPRWADPTLLSKRKHAYLVAIQQIKATSARKKYLDYFDHAFLYELAYLKRNSIPYSYVNPQNPQREKDTVSFLDYLKIVKYSLFELNRDNLVALNEVPFIKIIEN